MEVKEGGTLEWRGLNKIYRAKVVKHFTGILVADLGNGKCIPVRDLAKSDVKQI